MEITPGAQLGTYVLSGRLGSGGMGDVYKARDTRLNRTVAIKFLKTDPGSAEHANRFEREARAIAALNHPNICVIYDVGEQDGRRFLVMEYLEGETLAERLRKGPLPEHLALRYAHEVGAALSAAHARGLVHRDLKPANVMLTKSGAKLLDFGLAKAIDGEPPAQDTATTLAQPLTERWQIVGTLPYMAPERLHGQPSDARGDIFAFGAVLYEMLAGRRPFDGDTQAAIISAVLGSEPPPLTSISPALDRVIRRCLAKDAAERWHTMGDALEGLTLASAAISPVRATPPGRSPRRWIALAAILLAAIVAAIYWTGDTSPAPRPVVVLMDSTLPERVYDPITRANGGTNSDDLTDALSDLPLELHKETTSGLWRREDQVVQQHPALIMMHLSSFAQPTHDQNATHQQQALERTRVFIGFVGLASPRTQFVVYTRGYRTEAERQTWINETVARFPTLTGRVRMLHVPGEERATFRDPATRALVRQQIQSILGLPGR